MKASTQQRMRWVARLHFWVMFFAFVTYLGLSFSLGPAFLSYDIQKKIHALADDIIVVTATVLGPPATPVVTATPVCVSGAPRITLDWADDAATTSWDIERDSLPLTTGLVTSGYSDTVVTANTSYTYIVLAYGPMSPGSATSLSVSATALDCSNILPPPTVTIETLGGKNVATNRVGIAIERRTPTITGTTNIPNAIIEIFLTNPTMQAIVTANANGYFSWVPPRRLDSGNHILSVTATDPNDTSRTATDTFIFRTVNEESEEASIPPVTTTTRPPKADLDFFVRVKNGANLLFQGEELLVGVESTGKAFPVGTIFRSFVIDRSGQEIFRLPEVSITLPSERTFSFAKEIPKTIEPGNYRVRVDAYTADEVISREASFELRAWPLLEFAGGRMITYPQVVSFFGWIFFLLLTLFLFFLLLFVREYWLYLHSLRHITERQLERLGFLGKGKGVRRL